MKFVRDKDYGTYWIEEKFNKNLSIMVECIDIPYNVKHLKEFKKEIKKKRTESFEWKMMEHLTESMIEHYKKLDGKYMDTEELCSEVFDGGGTVYEGSSYKDAEDWCYENYDLYEEN